MLLAVLLSMGLQCGDVCSLAAYPQYAALLAASRYGIDPVEHGAFLIRGEDGSLRLSTWQTRERRSTSYKGRIPEGAVAIVHTHPPGETMPSMHDRRESARVGLPIVVVTADALTVAWPDRTVSRLATNARWQRDARVAAELASLNYH